MLKSSQYHLEAGDYDLAAFLAEQAAQLSLKHKIFALTGEMPRTHVLRQLFGILQNLIKDKSAEIQDFTKRHRSLLIRLEEAYIASRYLVRRYDKEETEELVSFARRILDFVSNL